jgi:Uma2 family endonuclease
MLATSTSYTLRPWTVAEYHHMAEMGVFRPTERVELIAGQIIQMIAKGKPHTTSVGRLDKLLQKRLDGKAWIRQESPIQLDDFSEPEPDIAVVQIDPLDYADHHPVPSEVYWLVEVADSSFKYDYEVKGKAYACSGIAEYWLLDVHDRKLYVFRQPTPDGYQAETLMAEDEIVSPLQFPDLAIVIREILPPVIQAS